MAPLCDALQGSITSSIQDGKKVYRGKFDKTYVIGSVPQGGYSLGLLLQACIDHQASTKHKDPIHLTGHYLQATSATEYEVHVKVLKTGRGFSNLLAELIQQGSVKITAHAIFGDLTPDPNAPVRLALEPPSPYARRLPLTLHPSEHAFDTMGRPWSFKSWVSWSLDKDTMQRNETPERNASTNAAGEKLGGGGMNWAAWCQLRHGEDRVVTSSMPFFGDMFTNLPNLLPKSEPAAQGELSSWYPTMVMSVEFKARLPARDSKDHSARTVGLFCETRFLGDPQGRHNPRVEVWTAPSDVGDTSRPPTEGWRDKQYCIAVAEQMCLTIPFAVNQKEGTRDRAKL